MSDLMTLFLVGVSAFAGGVFCGASVVGPKIYSAVTGTLGEMSRDLNPGRNQSAA